jgi:hypothetical protein
MQSAFGGEFTGKFDLVLEPPVEPFAPASTEMRHLLDEFREELEMGLSLALENNYKDQERKGKDRREYTIKLETLCQVIGRILQHEYDPDEKNISVTTTKQVMTMEEYAASIAPPTEKPNLPKLTRKETPDFLKPH